MLPEPNQIAELRHKDEIDRAVAEHLIRDRNIATPRVRDRRDLHRRSLTPGQAYGNESGRTLIAPRVRVIERAPMIHAAGPARMKLTCAPELR